MDDRIVAAAGADRTPPELLAPADKPDPFEQQWWTVMQVLAWVYLGNRAVVRDASPPEPFETFTMRDLQVVRGRDGACYPRVMNAEDAVIDALQAGRLTAYGLENGKGDRKEIPSLLWADLEFRYDDWDDPKIFAGPKDFSRTATYWTDLRFQRRGVLAVWPDPLESPAMADEQAANTADRAGSGACYRHIANAEEAVIDALPAGRLTASGVANGEGDRKEIPALSWADLEFRHEPYYFAGPKDFSRTATYWTDLRFQRRGVLAVWPDPLESPAMADKQAANTADRARSAKRTDPATATREARRASRLQDLTRFIDDVYEAANQGDFNLGSSNDRKALPFSRHDLRTVFREHHREHDVEQATFNDDLHQISVKVKPGRKRTGIKYLRTILDKNNLG